jgi:hypothetical protein
MAEQHAMAHVKDHEDGSHEFYCCVCGHSVLINTERVPHMVTLVEGDASATHTYNIRAGNIEVRSVSANYTRIITHESAPAQLPGLDLFEQWVDQHQDILHSLGDINDDSF